MFMKNFLNTGTCLILDFKFFDPDDENVFGKMKDLSEEKLNHEFVGLKSNMYSMKNVKGRKYNTVKGVNIVTEFNEFKDTLFNKKVVRHKIKRIQSKKHKIRTYEIKKYRYRVLMIKMKGFIH